MNLNIAGNKSHINRQNIAAVTSAQASASSGTNDSNT
jgi:hypothetical protein